MSSTRPGRERTPCIVLGATGSVGQRLVALLAEHPWFELAAVSASDRSRGRSYGEACSWSLPTPMPRAAAQLTVGGIEPVEEWPLVFSALGSEVAGPAEEAWARSGALVVSNASSHRMRADVPLVVPEINPGHLALARRQPTRGAILANPNCSTIGLSLTLAPLWRAFGIERLHVVTMQALSGAGIPGVPALSALDNLVPFIPGEEEKLPRETAKILGTLTAEGVQPASLSLSAQCNRVAVLDGHTACVSLALGREVGADELRAAWEGFGGCPSELALPSAPPAPVLYLEEEDAPQPRLHRELGGGMAAVVGRLRPCPVLGWRYVTLSHNTLRGAAGGALLLAELAASRGLLEG